MLADSGINNKESRKGSTRAMQFAKHNECHTAHQEGTILMVSIPINHLDCGRPPPSNMAIISQYNKIYLNTSHMKIKDL